jgi:hypothetical protein
VVSATPAKWSCWNSPTVLSGKPSIATSYGVSNSRGCQKTRVYRIWPHSCTYTQLNVNGCVLKDIECKFCLTVHHTFACARYLAVEGAGVRPGPHTDELTIVMCGAVCSHQLAVPQATCDCFGMIVELCVHVFRDLNWGCV